MLVCIAHQDISTPQEGVYSIPNVTGVTAIWCAMHTSVFRVKSPSLLSLYVQGCQL